MATWQQLKTYLSERYSVKYNTADQCSLTFSYADKRTQLIVVDHFSALEREWVCIRTRVCERESLDPIEALKRSRELVIGNLCLDGRFYLLTETYLLSTLDGEEIELGMQVLARTADELEATLEYGDDRF